MDLVFWNIFILKILTNFQRNKNGKCFAFRFLFSLLNTHFVILNEAQQNEESLA